VNLNLVAAVIERGVDELDLRLSGVDQEFIVTAKYVKTFKSHYGPKRVGA
jgi:hypothetical protein